jgi:hypothetical protein
MIQNAWKVGNYGVLVMKIKCGNFLLCSGGVMKRNTFVSLIIKLLLGFVYLPGLHMSLRMRDRVSALIGSRCWDVAGSPASVAAAAAMME